MPEHSKKSDNARTVSEILFSSQPDTHMLPSGFLLEKRFFNISISKLIFPKAFHSRNQHKTQVRLLNISLLYAIQMEWEGKLIFKNLSCMSLNWPLY